MANNRNAVTNKARKSTLERLESALNRLQTGRPTHPKLIEAAKLRKLRPWSPTALALESGVSKKSFDREGSNYPSIWQRQQEIKTLAKEGRPTIASRSTSDANRLLRERVRDLEQKYKALLTQNAAMVRRLQCVDPEMARKVREQERLSKRGSRNPNQMLSSASTGEGSTIVHLYPERGE